MEFHPWQPSLPGRACTKRGCNRWSWAVESVKAVACSALGLKYGIWGLIVVLLPCAAVSGSKRACSAPCRVVLGRVCVLGEVEKAPSDSIAKRCSGTASLPGSRSVREHIPSTSKNTSGFKRITIKTCFLPCTEVSFLGWNAYVGATRTNLCLYERMPGLSR